MKSYFPDVNVWLALTYRGHQHHAHPQVMGDEARTQAEAWKAYDQLTSDARVVFHTELDLDALESEFRNLTATARSAPQQWPDAYLAAFAHAEKLVLVTFDQALSRLTRSGVLLLR
jgi:predicted nucleic acid-binding protein